MPAEKSVSKASENRRSNKPLMEKRRRARINQSLTELKSLILDAVKKDSSRHSKLEKADILEMTVKYLQNLQRQQTAASADSGVTNRFRAGFGECATEVSRFLENAEGFEANVRTRLLGHLTSYMNGLDRPSNGAATPSSTGVATTACSVSSSSSTVTSSAEPSPRATPSPSATDGTSSPPPPREKNTNPTVSSEVDINNNSSSSTKTCSVSTTTTTLDSVFSGLQLIPTRLANGEIAFILPTHYAVAAAQALALGRIETLPVLPVSNATESVTSWSRAEQTAENSRFTQTGSDTKGDSDSRDGENSTSPPTVDSDSDVVGRPAPSPQEKQPLYMSLDESVWRPW